MKRFWLDVILLALFVAELSFYFLPKFLHEVLGVAMTALIIFHVAINFRRLFALNKNINPRKVLKAVAKIRANASPNAFRLKSS